METHKLHSDVKELYMLVLHIALSLLICNLMNPTKINLLDWSNTFFFSTILLVICANIFMININSKIINANIDITDTLYWITYSIYTQLICGICCMLFNIIMNHTVMLSYYCMIILLCCKIITTKYGESINYELSEVIIDYL